MAGMGTVINAAAILAGGIIGMLFGKLISPRVQETLLKAMWVSTMFVGLSGALEKILQIQDGALTSGGTIMLIVSMAVGSLIGEGFNIERYMEQFGEWLKQRTGSASDAQFVDGFVTASLTVCVGAMAVVGSIQDGLFGDYSILAMKGLMDMIIIVVMTSSMGKGCVFSAIPVAIFQGTITVLARLIQPVLTEQALYNLSLTGSVLIFCVGANLIWPKKFRVMNMLPSIVIAVIWAL